MDSSHLTDTWLLGPVMSYKMGLNWREPGCPGGDLDLKVQKNWKSKPLKPTDQQVQKNHQSSGIQGKCFDNF